MMHLRTFEGSFSALILLFLIPPTTLCWTARAFQIKNKNVAVVGSSRRIASRTTPKPESSRPGTSTAVFVNVAADFVLGGLAGEDESAPGKNLRARSQFTQTRLSRPERKALEREKKANSNNNYKSRRKHNFAARQETLTSPRKPGEGRYDLHSTAGVVRLDTKTSTADDVMRALKRAQNLHDVHDLAAIERFLLENTEDSASSFAYYGYRGSLLARLAVAALHMSKHDIARNAINARSQYPPATLLPMESAAIVRGLLRVHNVTDALTILEQELSVPTKNEEDTTLPSSSAAIADIIRYRALSLASVASRHFFEHEPALAVLACQRLAALGKSAAVQQSGLTARDYNLPWARILQGALQCESKRREERITQDDTIDQGRRVESVLVDNVQVNVQMPCNVVYAVLNSMTAFPSDNSDRVYELLSNALVRRVVFVTGAVSMSGCPAADRGEAVFIGRSNVGKSSLVNMVTNRKSLAFTSKRPGKTQQFNFFAVNDKPGREKEIKYNDVVVGEADVDSFYIVDLPGFGYAKVPEHQRNEWLRFMHEYICNRRTLRVLFHLVDGRHGPSEEDARIMKQISQDLPSYATYVVVLTKSDKNVKGGNSNGNNNGNGNSRKNSGKVSIDLMQSLRQTMQENGLGAHVPVIVTSAETKLGRDDMWRYLRLAAEA